MILTADVIRGFSQSLLQKNFDGAVATPACHMEWWNLYCSPNPQVAIAAPRRHAKSTAVTHTATLASMLFRDRTYCLVVSDTITQAEQFVEDIKRELAENEQLRAVFKIRDFPKDSVGDFICRMEDGHTFRVSAKGAEQKLRGLKWDNKRPDLIVIDDLENDEIVLNRERREKFKRWFYGSLLPCRSYRGIVRYVGTILHNDSLLENLMPKRNSTTFREEGLKQFDVRKKRSWVAYKYKAHNPDFSEILWSEQYDKEYFVNLRADYIEQGIPDVYSQEYLNNPLDETLSFFKRADLVDFNTKDIEIFKQDGWKKKFSFYISSDLAVSTKETADWSVFTVGAVNDEGMLYIVDVIRERMDAQEIVETLLHLEKKYHPECISMEKGQIEKAIGPFLHTRMLQEAVFPIILPLAPSTDKKTRARSIQARMRMGGLRVNKAAEWYFNWEDELLLFGRGKHDDQVDSLAYLGLILDRMIEGRTDKEIAKDEYDEYAAGFAESSSDDGRNGVTGY